MGQFVRIGREFAQLPDLTISVECFVSQKGGRDLETICPNGSKVTSPPALEDLRHSRITIGNGGRCAQKKLVSFH